MAAQETALAPAPDLGLIERTLVTGDLSKLTGQQRAEYYDQVCRSLGLNPLTRPFDYLSLNNKLVLYARKDCADQLRSIRKVSIVDLQRAQEGDLFVVTATAQTPDGRRDTEIGAVSVKGLQGEALANATMKAVTKAKRRVTLSICGLGMLDETEVSSIPQAVPVYVDHVTGEIIEPAPAPARLAAPAARVERQAPSDHPVNAGNVPPVDTDGNYTDPFTEQDRLEEAAAAPAPADPMAAGVQSARQNPHQSREQPAPGPAGDARATPAQIRMLNALYQQHGDEAPADMAQWTRREASDMITSLKASLAGNSGQ